MRITLEAQEKLKRNLLVILGIFFIIFGTSSCSWLSKRKTLFDDVTKESDEAPSGKKMSQKKYDDLMKKYEDLLRKYNEQQVANRGGQSNKSESEQLIKDLGASRPGIGLAETVDVFGKNGIANQAKKEKSGIVVDSGLEQPLPMSDKKLESEVAELNKAIDHLRGNRFDQGMEIFKKLEKSESNQIRVRAKYFIGDLLFIQKEYDLSLQIFEDLIQNYAFSGVTLKALGRLIVCSQQLKLKEKEERYYSILHDFFGRS